MQQHAAPSGVSTPKTHHAQPKPSLRKPRLPSPRLWAGAGAASSSTGSSMCAALRTCLHPSLSKRTPTQPERSPRGHTQAAKHAPRASTRTPQPGHTRALTLPAAPIEDPQLPCVNRPPLWQIVPTPEAADRRRQSAAEAALSWPHSAASDSRHRFFRAAAPPATTRLMPRALRDGLSATLVREARPGPQPYQLSRKHSRRSTSTPRPPASRCDSSSVPSLTSAKKMTARPTARRLPSQLALGANRFRPPPRPRRPPPPVALIASPAVSVK